MGDPRRSSAALILLLLLTLISLAYSSAAAASTRPGFLYTRTRGRCTPQFWSSRTEAWPRMVPQTASVSNVFGPIALERFRSDLTLLESATRNDGASNPFVRLLHQGTAALLNSYSRRPRFPFSPWQVKTLLIQGLVSESAAARRAQQFSAANLACS
ncbi:unnamed protein product [Linum tenue]|uniref:Uncharacterized protein n=1 Tax=Linum tenue TaxID=586396 RepID=A0AAV0LLV5_9ROSI|nr:unnamed protein product [Linum tenue]